MSRNLSSDKPPIKIEESPKLFLVETYFVLFMEKAFSATALPSCLAF
jgi:hypothetical protein